MEKPDRRGATIWVETDGTVYWSIVEFAVRAIFAGGNRNDNKFIDNATTFRQVNDDNSIGVEFVGNYPNVRRRVTQAQVDAWRMLAKVLQTRYDIPSYRVYAHNWVDHKDLRVSRGLRARHAGPRSSGRNRGPPGNRAERYPLGRPPHQLQHRRQSETALACQRGCLQLGALLVASAGKTDTDLVAAEDRILAFGQAYAPD